MSTLREKFNFDILSVAEDMGVVVEGPEYNKISDTLYIEWLENLVALKSHSSVGVCEKCGSKKELVEYCSNERCVNSERD
jgi:hypothetical protein